MSEKAISFARDILGGRVKAGWSADWPFEMAEGVIALMSERDQLVRWLRFYSDLTDDEIDYMLKTFREEVSPAMDWVPPEVC